MNAPNAQHLRELFGQIAAAAGEDTALRAHVRDALAESGLLEVFGTGDALDVVDLLDAGGEAALRARLHQLTLTELRQIISVRNYDPGNESARWRSPNKLIDLIVCHAGAQLEQELAQQQPSGASWML